jgi:hypothetical protein
VNPKAGIPVNLLAGVNATDLKDGDLTARIKVFVKDQYGHYILITNPTAYVVEIPCTLYLKYQVTDNSNQTAEVEKSLIVIQEALTVPQMQIMPTDPAFNPDDPGW